MITVFAAGLAAMLASAAPIRSLSGTLAVIEGERPTKLMVHAESQFQTFPLAERAVVERESRFAGERAATTKPIDRSDLTPGEFVRLELDAAGRITRARAVVVLERAKVRSASGVSVVLEDGTTLTIGSVLRFVTADGKPSETATVRAGESVLLFRHPETRNIYRFSAEARASKRAKTPKPPPR
jgi:hypothetical protein